MIIIPHRPLKPRYQRGGQLSYPKPRYSYGGYGIWSIGRKLIGDSGKKVINSVSTKKIIQNAGNAAIEGATSSLKRVAEQSLDKLINSDKNKKFKISQELLDRIPQSTTGEGIVFD